LLGLYPGLDWLDKAHCSNEEEQRRMGAMTKLKSGPKACAKCAQLVKINAKLSYDNWHELLCGLAVLPTKEDPQDGEIKSYTVNYHGDARFITDGRKLQYCKYVHGTPICNFRSKSTK
jgi:hypothetical protein